MPRCSLMELEFLLITMLMQVSELVLTRRTREYHLYCQEKSPPTPQLEDRGLAETFPLQNQKNSRISFVLPREKSTNPSARRSRTSRNISSSKSEELENIICIAKRKVHQPLSSKIED